MGDALNELFELCAKYTVDFEYRTNGSGKNTITYDQKEKKLTIDLCDSEDEKFGDRLRAKINELKQLFD